MERGGPPVQKGARTFGDLGIIEYKGRLSM